MRVSRTVKLAAGLGALATALSGCSSVGSAGDSTSQRLPPAHFVNAGDNKSEPYVIGALDQLTIFVWRNPELSAKVQVRPDGRITTPLIRELQAAGRTPSQLADEITVALSTYIDKPIVSVMVDSFTGTFSQQIRIVGATDKPIAIPYRADMTLLDVMIAVGGLSEFAAGDRARLVRHDKNTGRQMEYNLKIARLVKRGDTKANVRLEPGDVIIIPEALF